MAKRAIGIDITPYGIRAVQITEKNDRYRVEKSFAEPTRRSSDSLPAILKDLTNRLGFDSRAPVAIAQDSQHVFYRAQRLDPTELQQVRAGDSNLLEACFPIEAQQILTEICTLGRVETGSNEKQQILIAATSEAALKKRVDLLASAHKTPILVDAEIYAVRASVLTNYPQIAQGQHIIVYADECHLAQLILQEGQVAAVRITPLYLRAQRQEDEAEKTIAELLCSEVGLTWEKVFDHPLDTGNQLLVASDLSLSDTLVMELQERLGCPCHLVDPFRLIEKEADVTQGTRLCVAQGLALRALAPKQITGIDFLARFRSHQKPIVNLKREASILASLLVALLVVWMAGLFTERFGLEACYGQLESQIQQTFKELVPNEKNIVKPLVQLQQKLTEFQQDHRHLVPWTTAHPGLMTILYQISTTSALQSDVVLKDLLVYKTLIEINASSASPAQAKQWQQQLSALPHFTNVEMQDPRLNPDTQQFDFKMVAKARTPRGHHETQ